MLYVTDKVVIQRARRAQMHTHLVWRGGETTTFEVPVAVGARTDLPGAPETAQQMRGLFAEGTSADEMARGLAQHSQGQPPHIGPGLDHGVGHPNSLFQRPKCPSRR